MRPQILVLAVDLDGTLLRSDVLHESLWAAFGADWRQLFASARALLGGRALFKRYLAEHAVIDVTTLPYDKAVIEYVRSFRAKGGRAVLVTATDQIIAEKIATHLDLFDEVHGSDGVVNLKAAEKAAFLNAQYGAGQYAYMGDAHADLQVWKHTGQAITVNVPAGMRRQVEALSPQTEHLSTKAKRISDYIRAVRPHQWLKNLMIFLPMLAGHAFTAEALLASLLAFVAFSMVASSAYVMNDLLDLSADRAHPRKCLRPFAAGQIPLAHGMGMAVGLLVGGLVLALLNSAALFIVVLGYYLLTVVYSLYLKRRAVVDICVLAGLYTVRIIAGGAATGLELSVWLLAFSTFLFFSLAAVKRQAELVDNIRRNETVVSGRGYHVDDLPIVSMMALAAGYVAVLVMALYLNVPTTQEAYPLPEALWGICCVLLYWISRMVMMAHRGMMHDDPIVYAAKNNVSRLCLLLLVGFWLVAYLS